MDSMEHATIFTNLDCNFGYWQVAFAEEDRDKAVFFALQASIVSWNALCINECARNSRKSVIYTLTWIQMRIMFGVIG